MSDTLTSDEFAALLATVDNRGRWGERDERGTLNFLTAERTRAATALVRSGTSIGLGAPLTGRPGAVPGASSPVHHLLGAGGPSGHDVDLLSDYLALEPHGPAVTHLDALSHVAYRGLMHNGHPLSDATTRGTRSLAVAVAADGVVARGVLLDVPRGRGVPWLEPDAVVRAAELRALEREHGGIEPGDVVFVRTGRYAREAALGPWDVGTAAAGLHPDTLPWLHEREVAVLAGDGAIDAVPAPVRGVRGVPMHVGALQAIGLPLLHHCDLEALADACAAGERTSFLTVIAPLVLTGATGSPVNPIAVL